MKKTYLPYIIITVLLFSGCSPSSKRYIPKVPENKLPEINISIKRYGKELFSLDTNNLQKELKSIQNKYLLFLDADLNDTNNIIQIKGFVSDTTNRKLFKKTIEVYPDLKNVENQLSSAYSHLKYFFPKYNVQNFYSYISGIYYEQPVMVYDNFVLIGLDNYLGRNCKYYDRLMIPKYKSKWMIPDEISLDIMRNVYISLPQTKYKPDNLLDMMINAGKMLFFIDAVMPNTADTLKIKYSSRQLKWVENNEKNIWGFLVSEKLLFSSDFKQTNKLMQDGPFTNGFSREAPSRLGEWIGWQIVSSYMKNNPEVTLRELLKETDSQKILNKSGYKP